MKNERLGVDQFSDLATTVIWAPAADETLYVDPNTEVIIATVPSGEGTHAHIRMPSVAAFRGRRLSIYVEGGQRGNSIDVDHYAADDDSRPGFLTTDLDLTMVEGDHVRIECDGQTMGVYLDALQGPQ